MFKKFIVHDSVWIRQGIIFHLFTFFLLNRIFQSNMILWICTIKPFILQLVSMFLNAALKVRHDIEWSFPHPPPLPPPCISTKFLVIQLTWCILPLDSILQKMYFKSNINTFVKMSRSCLRDWIVRLGCAESS